MKITISVEEALMLDCIHDMREAYVSQKEGKVGLTDSTKIMTEEFYSCMRLLDAAGVK